MIPSSWASPSMGRLVFILFPIILLFIIVILCNVNSSVSQALLSRSCCCWFHPAVDVVTPQWLTERFTAFERARWVAQWCCYQSCCLTAPATWVQSWPPHWCLRRVSAFSLSLHLWTHTDVSFVLPIPLPFFFPLEKHLILLSFQVPIKGHESQDIKCFSLHRSIEPMRLCCLPIKQVIKPFHCPIPADLKTILPSVHWIP